MANAGRVPREAGFTLLEVLVAFVLLATLLGVTLNLNSLALDTTHRAADRQLALMLAQSQIDRILAERELPVGRQSGRFDDERFEWELLVEAFEFPDGEPEEDVLGGNPYEIELTVHWGHDQRLSLHTLRLVRPL